MSAFLMRAKRRLRGREPWAWALAGAVLLLWNAGNVALFDWDEINFAEIAREMLVLGDPWRVHVGFEPFWEKPPLVAWMQALCFWVFGVHDAAARIPNVFAALATVMLALRWGRRWRDEAFARRWAWLTFACVLPHFYFKVGLIDPWFNALILWAYAWALDARWKTAGLCLGLAVLAKGPVAYGLMAPLALSRTFRRAGWGAWSQVSVPALAVGGAWYAALFFRQPDQWKMFLDYLWRLFSSPDAGHRGGWGFHVLAVAFGCVPASMAVLGFERKQLRQEWKAHEASAVFAGLMLWVLVVFTIVQTKIVHYSSLVYVPLAYWAAAAPLGSRATRNGRLRQGVGLALVWMVWALGFAAIAWMAGDPLSRISSIARWIPNVEQALQNGNLSAALSMGGAPGLSVAWMWVGAVAALVGVVAALRGRNSMAMHGVVALVVAQVLFGAVLPSVMRWTQEPFVKFAKTLVGRPCILISQDFRSYVQFYYAQRSPDVSERSACQYFVVKPSHEAALASRTDLRRVGKFGQFAFYEKVLH